MTRNSKIPLDKHPNAIYSSRSFVTIGARRPKVSKRRSRLAKRFKITGTGKVMRFRAPASAILLATKNAKRRRRQRPAGRSDRCISYLQSLPWSHKLTPNCLHDLCGELPTPPLPASAASGRSRPPKAIADAAPNATVARRRRMDHAKQPMFRDRKMKRNFRCALSAHQRFRAQPRHDLQPCQGRSQSPEGQPRSPRCSPTSPPRTTPRSARTREGRPERWSKAGAKA